MYRNVSLFALPIYWLLSISVRFISVAYLRRHQPSSSPPLVNNASPHSTFLQQRIQQTLPASVLNTYERIHAAHRNCMENLPFFYGAVIAANFARINALEVSLCAWLFVATRVVYVACYATIESDVVSYSRSAAFGAGVVLNWWLLLRAAVFTLYDYEALH